MRKRDLQQVARTFLAGAAIFLPLALTVWAIWKIVFFMHDAVVTAARFVTLDSLADTLSKVPGLGLLLFLALIYLLGLATRFWMFSKALARLDFLLDHIPLVRTIYGAVRDLMRFFSGDSGSMGKVVLYKVPGQDAHMLAILTTSCPSGLSPEQADGRVAIYLPMSYQIGGYMLYVPASSLEPVDMSVEAALKLAATAEVGVQRAKGLTAPVNGISASPPAGLLQSPSTDGPEE